MANGLSGRFDPVFFRHLVVRQIRQDDLENVIGLDFEIANNYPARGEYTGPV